MSIENKANVLLYGMLRIYKIWHNKQNPLRPPPLIGCWGQNGDQATKWRISHLPPLKGEVPRRGGGVVCRFQKQIVNTSATIYV